jgi:hypothetical protein
MPTSSSSFFQELNPAPADNLTVSEQVLAAMTTQFGPVLDVFIATLPTSDPHVLGKPWWNGESFSLSQG